MVLTVSEKELKKFYFTRFGAIILVLIGFCLVRCFTAQKSGFLSTAIMLGIMVLIFLWFVLGQYKNTVRQSKNIAMKALDLRREMEKISPILCEGEAAHRMVSPKKPSTGWMILTEQMLSFYELGEMNLGGDLSVDLGDILETTVAGNGIAKEIQVRTQEKTYCFGVYMAETWKQQIDRAAAAQNDN